MRTRRSTFILFGSWLLGCAGASEPSAPSASGASSAAAPASVMSPPSAVPARVSPPVAERVPKTWSLHGRSFSDDYAWLRQKDDPKVLAHLKAENAYADAVLAKTGALQETLYQEMVGRMPEDDQSAPFRKGQYFYYQRQVKGREHPIHCRKRGHLDAPEQVLLDLNAVAAQHKFAALGPRDVSPSGRHYAFALDRTGFRQFELRVRDLEKNVELATRVERVTSVAFAGDDKTLFYTVEDPVAKRSHRVYRHVLGANPSNPAEASSNDTLVYEEKDERFEVEVEHTRSRRFIVIKSESHTTSEARLVRADKPNEPPRLVLPRKQDQEYEVETQGERLLVRINDRGRNFRLVALSLATPDFAKALNEGKGTELVAHRADVMLEAVEPFREFMVLHERTGGLPRLTIVDAKAKGGAESSHVVSMEDAAYDVRLEGNVEYDTRTLRYVFQSPITPALTIDYDVDTRQKRVVKRAEVRGGFDRDRYSLHRLLVAARDGVSIPVTLVVPKGTVPTGKSPLVLYGYGAYGFSVPVRFSSPILSLVDRGVGWAIAHVRGGGELGKPWHDAGRMANKKKSFEDFIDVGEALVKLGWAKKDALGAWGGSAGGLLVAASTNLRPDLFRAVVAEVPFVDVLNTMLDEKLPLTVGEFEEWGNPKKPTELGWMAEYSPYDNLAPRAYPAMLVRTSYNDSQVMYWEPAKYVARLRTQHKGETPVLFKTLLDPAGHGGKSGRYETLKERAYDYAFVLWQLGAWQSPAARPYPR